jgi:hypothetical protein
MLRKSVFAALVAAIAAALVWAASSSVTGKSEPWDAEGGYYIGGLLIAGLVAGAIAPYALWAHYCGGIAGQLVYMVLFERTGPLIGVGVLFLALYALVLLGGSFVGARIRVALR